MSIDHSLTPELEKMRQEIEEACQKIGLSTSIEPDKKTIFQMMDFSELNMVTSYTGFPTRYPHWRFGMEYEHLRKKLGWGFGRLYEIVINTSPPIAYLLEYNEPIQQKMVMAHVYAHVDFFANNHLFKPTNRNMLNVMAGHSAEIERYINRHGVEEVEKFIDICLSIENLIDPFSTIMKREPSESDEACDCGGSCGSGCKNKSSGKLPAKDYMDPFINPKKANNTEKKEEQNKEKSKVQKTPTEPYRDVLKYLIEHADGIAEWQRNILSMIREESYYFAPQRQTKIINEGWATFWHSYIMSHLGHAGCEGITGYAKTHSGVVGMAKPGILTNPYTVGLMLFRYIKDTWDKGKHGPEYEKIRDIKSKKEWNTKEMKGLEKIFEVRKFKDDIGFIREFMTPDFIEENQLFIYKYDEQDGTPRIHDRDPERIKKMFLDQLTNMGEPIIYIENGNFQNRKELLLKHDVHGYQLDLPDAKKTLVNIFQIWKRPVYIKSAMIHPENGEQIEVLLKYDGKEHGIYKVGKKKDEGCDENCSNCRGNH